MHFRHKLNFWKNKSKDTTFIDDLNKLPELQQIIKYDENFNNKRKVVFESCLAGIIRSNPRMLYPSIVKVASSILPDFMGIFEKIKNALCLNRDVSWLHQHFFDFFSNNPDILIEYKRCNEQKPSSPKDEFDNFSKWIYAILSSTSEENAYVQLLLIREYGNYFLRPFIHMPEFSNLNHGKGIQIVPEGAGNTNAKLAMKLLWDKYISSWSGLTFQCRISTQSTFRAKVTTMPGIFATKSDYNAVPASLRQFCPEIHVHLPGKNLWRVTSESKFAATSRYILDMPLIADQGGSIALILIPAIILGNLNKEELRYFNLNAIGYMVGNGHHSINEFQMVWDAFDIPYTLGEYASLFPPDVITKHPELLKLQKHFSDLLPSDKEKANDMTTSDSFKVAVSSYK